MPVNVVVVTPNLMELIQSINSANDEVLNAQTIECWSEHNNHIVPRRFGNKFCYSFHILLCQSLKIVEIQKYFNQRLRVFFKNPYVANEQGFMELPEVFATETRLDALSNIFYICENFLHIELTIGNISFLNQLVIPEICFTLKLT